MRRPINVLKAIRAAFCILLSCLLLTQQSLAEARSIFAPTIEDLVRAAPQLQRFYHADPIALAAALAEQFEGVELYTIDDNDRLVVDQGALSHVVREVSVVVQVDLTPSEERLIKGAVANLIDGELISDLNEVQSELVGALRLDTVQLVFLVLLLILLIIFVYEMGKRPGKKFEDIGYRHDGPGGATSQPIQP